MMEREREKKKKYFITSAGIKNHSTVSRCSGLSRALWSCGPRAPELAGPSNWDPESSCGSTGHLQSACTCPSLPHACISSAPSPLIDPERELNKRVNATVQRKRGRSDGIDRVKTLHSELVLSQRPTYWTSAASYNGRLPLLEDDERAVPLQLMKLVVLQLTPHQRETSDTARFRCRVAFLW